MRTVMWETEGPAVRMIDQRLLPGEVVMIDLRNSCSASFSLPASSKPLASCNSMRKALKSSSSGELEPTDAGCASHGMPKAGHGGNAAVKE